MSKTYIGDAVYVDHRPGDQIVLTVEDGERIQALIFLEPEVWKALKDYVEPRERAGRWTTQPPTQPGWYWYKGGSGEVDIVEVWMPKGGKTLLASDNNATYEPANMDGTWYSEPLTAPPIA